MLKLFFIFSLFANSFLYAITLDIEKSDRDYPTSAEVSQLKKNLLIKKIKIDDKEASRVLEENMILSNLFLIENKLTEEMKNNFKILIEDRIANILVGQKEKDLDLNDDILLSYYKDKKKLFFSKEIATLKVYQFNDFNTALEFYQDFEKNPARISSYADDKNISMVTQKLELSAIHPQIKGYLRDKTEMNYLMPPQKWADFFIAIYVEKIQPEGFLPYEKVKAKIKQKLVEENRSKTKRDLIDYYKKQYGNDK